jgi:hypothetical protein
MVWVPSNERVLARGYALAQLIQQLALGSLAGLGQQVQVLVPVLAAVLVLLRQEVLQRLVSAQRLCLWVTQFAPSPDYC